MKVNLVKWKLMLTTLPISLLVLLLKIGIVQGLHYEGLVKFSEVGLIFTGGIFLMGFMLAGTLSDYKESEKIPAQMACAIEMIEDTMNLAHGFKGNFDLDLQRRKLHEMLTAIIRWFYHDEPEEKVYEKIKGISSIALCVEKTGIGTTAQRVTWAQTDLRNLFSRATVIKRTHFITTGYAFLEVLTLVIIVLLLISTFENQVISIIMVTFITQIFVYMVRLIKDIDHPFEYPHGGKVRAADIDLFPLVEYERRIESRL